ncbi:hypothetical protein ACLX1H_002762 [Fusarium chlamydosporum]
MSRRSDRHHRHSRSSGSHQTQQEDIPIDPSLTTEFSYPAYTETQAYNLAGPDQSHASEGQDTGHMTYYMMQQQQQPTTVNPKDLLLGSGSDYAPQSYASSAYQTAVYGMLPQQTHPKYEDKQILTNICAQKASSKSSQKPPLRQHNPPTNTTAQN